MAATFLTALLPVGATADEGIYHQNCLPPQDSYVGQFHALYAAGLINLSDPIHSDFASCDPPPPPITGGTTTHTFGSFVRFNVSVGGDPPVPMQAPGTVTVRVDFSGLVPGPNTQVFDTEMLQLDISGGSLPPGTLVRESPTLASTGQTTIRPLPGSTYAIDSFFDVFTELSLDGGQTWYPTESGPGRVTLSPSNPTPTLRSTWGRIKTIYR